MATFRGTDERDNPTGADGNDTLMVPRKIWMYWHQGWANAPDLVLRCAATWPRVNPLWDIRMLDAANLTATTGVALAREEQRLALPGLSDVIRIRLLERYGGVWADATLWCLRPLDAWIDPVCRHSGFFAYARPGEPAPWRPISSWFLAAGEGSRIVTLLRREVEHVLAHQGREGVVRIPTRDAPGDGEYLWFHRLFDKLLTTNREFQCLWDCTPKLNATGPHLLDETGFLSPVTPAAARAIQERTEHVFKLSHKLSIPNDVSGTVLDALYRSTEDESGVVDRRPPCVASTVGGAHYSQEAGQCQEAVSKNRLPGIS